MIRVAHCLCLIVVTPILVVGLLLGLPIAMASVALDAALAKAGAA